ncbi:hypothetical protein [Maribacter sp. 2307ULW6-5]|uniref:hypothetical protein n=1 Tax=Maribacter sp. 2307ULW6-5 TaxID=3386275 RepID=UPI0039BCDEAD
MKTVHFDNMRHWTWIAVIILSLILILVGTFELFEFENPKLNKRISAVGFFLQVIYFSKMFWYKNYVQWNKVGIVIKMNSLYAKSLPFIQIKKTELNHQILTIIKSNGKKITFNLDGIRESEAKRLHEIIAENTNLNNP